MEMTPPSRPACADHGRFLEILGELRTDLTAEDTDIRAEMRGQTADFRERMLRFELKQDQILETVKAMQVQAEVERKLREDEKRKAEDEAKKKAEEAKKDALEERKIALTKMGLLSGAAGVIAGIIAKFL